MKIISFGVVFLFSMLASSRAADLASSENGAGQRVSKGKPAGAADYVTTLSPTDGQNLALTLDKLNRGFDPPRPFRIWALGSSYTNMLGNGEIWKEQIPRRFPNVQHVEYQKMVGNSCPWQYVRGWARHLVIPDQPDLVLVYTLGKPADLEKLLIELRSGTTADIIVPSIHWRERDQRLWGDSENAVDQNVAQVRQICRKYGVEFVENRRDWAAYLTANGLPISALLKDAVHQSDYGARIINANILAHLQRPAQFNYKPRQRERRVEPTRSQSGAIKCSFTGNRIDLVGTKSLSGGSFQVYLDGQLAEQTAAFLTSYIRPDQDNARVGRGSVPRDQAPHAVSLGQNVVPQTWTLVMTSDQGDYQLTGSVTGPDGDGNAFETFHSTSGQIVIEPELWRRAERNRTGDRFTFDVRRAVKANVNFQGPDGERFSIRLAQALPGRQHTLELIPIAGGDADVESFVVYQPPRLGEEN